MKGRSKIRGSGRSRRKVEGGRGSDREDRIRRKLNATFANV